MKGFQLYNGGQDFRIIDGTRTVLTTEGMLVNLLPPSEDINLSFNVVFPDFTKDYLYAYSHLFSYSLSTVGYDSACQTQLTIPQQSFADEVNLMIAPASSDIFVGSIVMNRIAGPSNSWGGSSIDPLQPQNVKIPFVSGSLLVEAEFGMSRAFSIYVSGGQLKLHRQQSVSTAPGGWDAPGTFFGESYSFNGSVLTGGGGGNYYGSQPGIPVVALPVVNVPSFTVPDNITAPPRDTRTAPGGANACPIPNPASYNFGSTYAVTLAGAFGRRS